MLSVNLLVRLREFDVYKPIKPSATSLEASIVSGTQHLYRPCYTGWISSWSLRLDTLHTAYYFRYDRLGKLTRATTLTGFNGSEWNADLPKNYSARYAYDLVGNILNLARYDGTGILIDDLEYKYYRLARNNRLEYIIDKEGQVMGIDLGNQSPENYRYDLVGNMIEDKSRNMEVLYTYSSRPKRVKIGNVTINILYNPSGYRVFKGKGANKGQIFVYNSQGQLMAKYMINGRKLKLDFVPIYEGTKRLGILEPSGVLWIDCPPPRLCFEEDSSGFVQLLIPSGGGSGGVLKAERKYELTDHLGNVRVVIRDQRVPVSTGGTTVAYYKPLVDEISDYYPYGWQKFIGKYQFGANAGSLFEDWDSTKGTYYTLYRLLDARIARWYQVEPKDGLSGIYSFVFVEGKVTIYVDPLGDTIRFMDAYGSKVMMNALRDIFGDSNPFYIEGNELRVRDSVSFEGFDEMQIEIYNRLKDLVEQGGIVEVHLVGFFEKFQVLEPDENYEGPYKAYTVHEMSFAEMAKQSENGLPPFEGFTNPLEVEECRVSAQVFVAREIYKLNKNPMDRPKERIYYIPGNALLHELLIHVWEFYNTGEKEDEEVHHKRNKAIKDYLWNNVGKK